MNSKVYLTNQGTEKARERRADTKGLVKKDLHWSEISDEELKIEIFEEGLPVNELFDESIQVVHIHVYSDVCYTITLDKSYAEEFLCYVVVDKLQQDDSFLKILANNLSKVIDQRRKGSLMADIKSIAKKRYALLGKDDKRTLEDIEKEVLNSLGLND